jgi:hypothetical protein
MVEPQPTPGLSTLHLDDHRWLRTQPQFRFFRLRATGADR